MQNCSKSILSPGWVWPREAQASPSLIPKDSPSLPKPPRSIHTEFPKPSPSIPKPPQSIPKHSPSLPKPPRSIPKHSPSLPKHPKLPQRCRATIEQASPSLPKPPRSIPQAFPKRSPSLPKPPRSIPQAFPKPSPSIRTSRTTTWSVCVCVCVWVCACVCVCASLSGSLWVSLGLRQLFQSLTNAFEPCVHTYACTYWALYAYCLTYMYISLLGPMSGLIYTHKPPGAHIRLLGHVPSEAPVSNNAHLSSTWEQRSAPCAHQLFPRFQKSSEPVCLYTGWRCNVRTASLRRQAIVEHYIHT